MGKTIRVVIADDNLQFAEVLSEYLNNRNDIAVVGIAEDGLQAYDLIMTKFPDVVILDIIMPNLDGLGVLEKVFSLNMERTPVFIILSAIGQDKITQKALNLGAEYYLVKPIDMDILVSRIRQFSKPNDTGLMYVELENEKAINNVAEKHNLEVNVTEIMRELGIPANLKGYQFIRNAVMMTLADPESVNYITKQLYPSIAKLHNTTSSRVERAIRHAIEVTWNKGKTELINAIFGALSNPNKNRPTNAEFIATLSDKLRMRIDC